MRKTAAGFERVANITCSWCGEPIRVAGIDGLAILKDSKAWNGHEWFHHRCLEEYEKMLREP